MAAGGRRSAPLALVLALVLAACSGSKSPSPQGPQVLTAAPGYEQAVVKAGAAGLWSFRDATGLSARDEVADLTAAKRAATVLGGTIAQTVGPDGQPAAQFLRSGRVVTPIESGLSSSDTWSIELDLRADACVNAWGRVLGTTSLPKSGREGFELLHFPKQFQVSPCKFGVEFWHLNSYVGGCHPVLPPTTGVWTHWAVVYGAGKVRCYLDGALVDASSLSGSKRFGQLGPLGIGGSGSGFQGPLDGASVGEVAFYRRALTAAEVRAHAALAKPSTPKPGPKGMPTASARPSPTRS